MRKLVVFDLDGTLIDSRAIILAAQEATFRAHGLPMPDEETAISIVGLSLVEAFRTLVPDGPYVDMAATYKTAFQDLRLRKAVAEDLFPGAADLLERLGGRHDVVLGIATGKSRRGVAHVMDLHGWHGRFATIQTADDAPSKPHPAMLEQALGETGFEARQAVMIGDTTFDILMARSAGMASIGVPWGNHSVAALNEAGASRIVMQMEAIEAAIDALTREAAHG
jgi:phosphoglycolate phosphatase